MKHNLRPTADPDTFIESESGDSITYRRIDGKRWRVTGRCDRRGFCMVGAVVNGITIESVEHLNCLAHQTRIDSELDVPVGVNFTGCCPFKIERL